MNVSLAHWYINQYFLHYKVNFAAYSLNCASTAVVNYICNFKTDTFHWIFFCYALSILIQLANVINIKDFYEHFDNVKGLWR